MCNALTQIGFRKVRPAILLALLYSFAVHCMAQLQAPAVVPPQSAAPPASVASLAGRYDGGQMEVGAELLLKPDGHFEFGLAYGAMDEEGKGTWEIKDGAVFLTSVPTVVPPQFVVESDVPEPRGGLWIRISNGPLMEGSRQRVYLLYGPKEEPGMVEIADDGHVPLPPGRRPTAIIPEISVYPIVQKPIPLTGAGGHRIVMKFEKNDIGKADFRAQRLAIEDGVLVMERRDLGLKLRFRRREAEAKE